MATFRDWFATCHAIVPRFCKRGVRQSSSIQLSESDMVVVITPSPGVNMPTVTTKFESTKQDIRNGKKTASPVSVDRIY